MRWEIKLQKFQLKIAKACGCEFVETINPMNLSKTIDTYKRALEYDGVSVIIAKHPCTLIKGLKRKRPMVIKKINVITVKIV